MKPILRALCVFMACFPFAIHAQTGACLVPLGGVSFEGWSGLETADGSATLKIPGEAVFRYPQGAVGWHDFGFTTEHDGTCDWRGYYGVRFDVLAPAGSSIEIEATLLTPSAQDNRSEYPGQSKAVTVVEGGTDWKQVTLPWSVFDYNKGQGSFLKFIQALRLKANAADGKPGGSEVRLKNIRLTRAASIALETPVRGKAVRAGGTASYEVMVGNCTDASQEVNLSFEKYGWETMAAAIAPARLKLAPGASAACVVTVRVPEDGIPAGGHERQKLVALAGDNPVAALELITARDVPRPSIQHTVQGWNEVREKVKKYDWAKKSQEDDYVKPAELWMVPEVATPEQRAHGPEQHPYVFPNKDFEELPKAAIAWQLTRNKSYAEKAALFLRRLADEKSGYASTCAGTSMGEPQEGGNFQGVAIAYDAILDAGVLSEGDRISIERMLRLYMHNIELALGVGNVGNWSTAANTAGLFCALAMGDLAAAERYLYGPSGFADYVSKGIMDDGWWWECSSSYNFWVAAELTQSALACRPWGIDLLNREFPASYSTHTIITPWALHPPYGISFEKWGPNHRNTRSIKQLWDAVPPAADYRGITFGMNDGHEEMVGDRRLELGYYAFRDPLYAAIIKQAAKRDLIYGVPELPAETPKPWLNSGYAENLGYALLRSQTEKRPVREQIQAVFKIGTQGGYHGHFDRASLDSIMRYGRSFWNPESIWYGYGNFMYKFYVQTSVAHNMVVVDQKTQEAVPSSQLLFHSGKMMQVVAQETNARWSDPPYGGMKYSAQSSGGAVKDMPAIMKKNRQSFPLATDRGYGELGPYGDRVLQRRLGVVTDDFIVVADFVKSSQPHTFDNLFQMKGFSGLEGGGAKLVRHDAQFNPDPHGSAQFITDCDWYRASAPAVARFVQTFEPSSERKADHNEDGVLKIDVRSLWPAQQEIMVASAPELHACQQWVTWEASADGRSLAKGETGTWVIGAAEIDVPVGDAKELTLSVSAEGGKKKSLFLAHARFVDASGNERPLTDQPTLDNIEQPVKPGADYEGGPIKIAGNPYSTAIPAQPKDAKSPARIHIPLAGKNAVRFMATLGGDYPFGDESQQRKVYAIRSKGTEARFLTVLEPYENNAVVKSAVATGPDSLRVELVDGRVQELTINNLEGSGKDISVTISESKNGIALRHEASAAKGE